MTTSKCLAKNSNRSRASQWLTDPRQSLFLAYYIDPESETFSNALQSALKAGYAQTYAENITDKMPLWLLEKVGELKSSKLIEKAEQNLAEILDLPSKIQAMGTFGLLFDKKTGKPTMVYSPNLIRIKSDVSKFVVELMSTKYKKGKEVENRILHVSISKESAERYGINPSN